jgi:N-methylhydantoinase A/oxoprolinase/acetone carboxylase beta subunit
VNAPSHDSNIRLSADVGGTFTDVAAFDETTGGLVVVDEERPSGIRMRD